MKLTYPSSLVAQLSSSYVFLDTNVFLCAINNDGFYSFLLRLHDKGCALVTTQSVIFEFSRGAKSVEEYNWYVDYINNLGVTVYGQAEKELQSDKAFSVLLQAECKKYGSKASYTDFLLLMMLHKFVHTPDRVYLMTSNYKDVPTNLFERYEIIALEYEKGVQTQALYKNKIDMTDTIKI
jgi:hypothetical protein